MGVGEVTRRAVFLDRDGVISRPLMRARKPYPPRSPAELELLPGVPEALRVLKAAGYCLVVVTNQPDVARGTTPRAIADTINERLKAILPLDAILMCDHDDADRCECRKPQPGLLRRATRELDIDLAAKKLSAEQFKQVLLLPQGDFRRFLRATSAGRVDVVAEPVIQGRVQQLWAVTMTRADDGKVTAQGQLRLQNVNRGSDGPLPAGPVPAVGGPDGTGT